MVENDPHDSVGLVMRAMGGEAFGVCSANAGRSSADTTRSRQTRHQSGNCCPRTGRSYAIKSHP